MTLKHYYSSDYLSHLADITESTFAGFCVNGLLINFFLRDGICGTVANSNPFYGSHGGFHEPLPNSPKNFVTVSLGDLIEWLENKNIAALTIVENPYSRENEALLNQELVGTLRSISNVKYEKISRFSSVRWVNGADSEDNLLAGYHGKTRNCVRKFLKSDCQIKSFSPGDEGFENVCQWLATQHKLGIEAKNGLPKPFSYFQSLADYYSPDRLEIDAVFLDDTPIAGLLNFRIDNQKEYWTPVTTPMGKTTNAIYGLIHKSLSDISNNGGGLMNFGGSWATQGDLQRFKNRFGSEVREYNYHCFVFDELVSRTHPNELLKSYPYFFVRNF